MIAFDLSYSMETPDMVLNRMPINRLLAAKHVITQFVDSRPDDRIGIVGFAGKTKSFCPLTLDHALVNGIIRDFHPRMIPGGRHGHRLRHCGGGHPAGRPQGHQIQNHHPGDGRRVQLRPDIPAGGGGKRSQAGHQDLYHRRGHGRRHPGERDGGAERI